MFYCTRYSLIHFILATSGHAHCCGATLGMPPATSGHTHCCGATPDAAGCELPYTLLWYKTEMMMRWNFRSCLMKTGWQHKFVHCTVSDILWLIILFVFVCLCGRWRVLTCEVLLTSRQLVHWKALVMLSNWSLFTGQKVCSLCILFFFKKGWEWLCEMV